MPPSIHAGGLRYHGDAPIISDLVKAGRMRAVAYPKARCFEAPFQFAAPRNDPAPETAHAIRAVMDEALAAKQAGEEEGDPVLLLRTRAVGPRRYDDFLHGGSTGTSRTAAPKAALPSGPAGG